MTHPLFATLALLRVRPRAARRRTLSLAVRSALVCAPLLLAACDGDDITTQPPTLRELSIAVAPTTVVVGQTVTAHSNGKDQFGASIATGAVTWSSTAAGIATVASTGDVTGVAPGTTFISASVGAIAAGQTITVVAPALTTLTITVPVTTLVVGQSATGAVTALDQINRPIAATGTTWATSNAAVATVSTAGVVTATGAGSATISATAGGKTAQIVVTVTAPPAIKINEIESNGGTPGDWVELFNPTATAVDIAGWALKDNDDTRTFQFPAGTTIPAGGYLVVEEAQFGYGLGAADAARLYNQFGTTVDSHSWTAHALSTYGRCPNGTGAFATTSESTKGAVNDCRVLVRVNEVESNGGTPGDWIEFYNVGTTPVDLSGYIVKDNDDTRTSTIPAGTIIAANSYYVIDESVFGFGLGSADAARLFTPAGVLVDSHAWTAHAAITYGRCPDGTGPFAATSASTKGAANDCRGAIRINEVESNGGTPGDWIELYNVGSTPVDISNFLIKDDDDTRTARIPAGTTIAAGGFYVIEEAVFGFGLGAADQARIFDASGTLLDGYAWTAHAAITYGRCPDGSGAFAATSVSTKGAANTCAPVGPVTNPWPGSDDVTTVDGVSVFQTNGSGLAYEGAGAGPGVLWAVRNGPGTLFRMIFSGGIWTPDPANSWAAGKALKYVDGTGNPDSEGVTFAAGGAAGGIYVATERNNDASTISRSVVLRVDPTAAGATLTATNQWDLTADLPATGANLGLEAITWVPDSMLVANGFYDESKSRAYNPADYANHGTGLFFVGLEANGNVYVYALNHVTNSFTRIAAFSSGFPGIMDLAYDRESGYLWGICDDTCSNTAAIFELDRVSGSPTAGRFLANRKYARPSTLPNINNEGFTFAPNAECVANRKPVFWADDNETGGHTIRKATIPCGAFAPRAPSSRAPSSRAPRVPGVIRR